MARKNKNLLNSNFEIEDEEMYLPEPEMKYSHELLVMEQLRSTLKSLSQEMKKGFEERKLNQVGGLISIKVTPDTRKEAAERVKTLKNIMVGYIEDDKDAHTKIKDLFKQLEDLEDKYIKLEEEAWKKIPEHIKHPNSNWSDRWDHIVGTLNFDHYFGEKYLQESIIIYREILEEIIVLLHNMEYFKASKSF